jgi:outer membrane protein OmpA-like peptidoglycan-associated protein
MKIVFFVLLLLTSLGSFGQEDSTVQVDAPLSFPITIYYQNNSAEISHVSRLRLAILTDYMIENPSVFIVIEGHVCCGPDIRMSRKRARSVYKRLLKLGAPKDQMRYIGKSFDEPKIKKERNEQDKNMNRRVEIELENK